LKIQMQKAALAVAAAAATLATVTPAHASASAEESFVALRSIDAETLSPAEMQSITGEATLDIAAALREAAARASNPTTASSLNSLAAAYSQITIQARLFINRVLVIRR
jgi:hypothetical protein